MKIKLTSYTAYMLNKPNATKPTMPRVSEHK